MELLHGSVRSVGSRKPTRAIPRERIGWFEPFSFGRKGRRPGGSETDVAFTLAFAVDTRAPEAGFFVSQQHFPESFWNPAFSAMEAA